MACCKLQLKWNKPLFRERCSLILCDGNVFFNSRNVTDVLISLMARCRWKCCYLENCACAVFSSSRLAVWLCSKLRLLKTGWDGRNGSWSAEGKSAAIVLMSLWWYPLMQGLFSVCWQLSHDWTWFLFTRISDNCQSRAGTRWWKASPFC